MKNLLDLVNEARDIDELINWFKHELLIRQNEECTDEQAVKELLDMKKISYPELVKYVLKNGLDIGIYPTKIDTRNHNDSFILESIDEPDFWNNYTLYNIETTKYEYNPNDDMYYSVGKWTYDWYCNFTYDNLFEFEDRNKNGYLNRKSNSEEHILEAKTRCYTLDNIAIGDRYWDDYNDSWFLVVYYDEKLVANYRINEEYTPEDIEEEYKPVLIRLAHELNIDEGSIIECFNKYIKSRMEFMNKFKLTQLYD